MAGPQASTDSQITDIGNTTHMRNSEIEYGVAEHLPNLIVNCVFAAITLYLLIAFCFYEYTKLYWSVCRDERNSKIARILRALCIVGVTFAFIHHVCEIVATFLSDPNTCQVMNTIWLLTYTLGILTAYIFLWQRQHWFYEGPALKHLLNGCIKAFSWIALGFLVISAITVFLAGSRMIVFSSCGKHSEDSQKLKLYETILAITLLVLTTLGQVQLLILFIIPLWSHAKKVKKSVRQETNESSHTMADLDSQERPRANTQSSPVKAKKKNRSGSSIFDLVKRCLFLASISMVSDITAAAVTLLVENEQGRLVYDMNILVNVMCCVGSFKTWTGMVFPWKRTMEKCKRRDRQSTKAACSSSGV